MKCISVWAISAFLMFSSCKQREKVIVESLYIDSLVLHYNTSQAGQVNKTDLLFWKKKSDSLPENFVNGPKYASALSTRFRLYGDIHDLLKADSFMKQSNLANQEKEDGILLTLASLALQQHQFHEAIQYVEKATKVSDNKYSIAIMDFDAQFEAGQYDRAAYILKTLRSESSYAWSFRKAKYEHYSGTLDSSIFYMLKAVAEAGNNKYLKQVALSNAADLCVHKGDLKKAYNLYKESIAIDAADFHSIGGMGWIALVHDKNDSLAYKIFSFARQHNASPDLLFKMEQVAEAKGDNILREKMAEEFTAQASQAFYGNMYNKYLVTLYTSVLNNPAKAVTIAEKEIINRHTPQTYAWYAWALLNNKEKEKAYTVYKSFVSGKPLEGLELYYMGKLMQSMDKGYNAQQYFKAAYTNRFDLSPEQVKDLEKNLE